MKTTPEPPAAASAEQASQPIEHEKEDEYAHRDEYTHEHGQSETDGYEQPGEHVDIHKVDHRSLTRRSSSAQEVSWTVFVTDFMFSKEEEYAEENEDEEDPKDDYGAKQSAEVEHSNADVEYDEETKQIVEQAKNAKHEFADVESRHSQVETKIRDLESSLTTDYGAEDEFMAVHGQCFEYTDREYTYKLCPFDRASQRPKDGGSETSLG